MRRLYLLAFVVLFVATPALADNPVARHGMSRTGLTTGTSNITDPTQYWSYYLGGAPSPNGLLVEDINLDGTSEVVYLTGGRLVAARSTGETLWSSEPRDMTALIGASDLDNDGDLELVARARANVIIVDASSGALEWVEPDGEMGTVGAVRIADLDRDLVDDVVISECGCCGVNSGNPGVVYSFAAGFSSPQQLWSLPFSRCGNGRSLTVVDMDGDGTEELLVPDLQNLVLVDGETGTQLAASPPLVDRAPLLNCVPANLDGDAGNELVCLQSSPLSSTDVLYRAVALDYDAMNGTLNVLYNQETTMDDGDMRWVDPVVDLDGDGDLELVYSVATPGGEWTTWVRRASNFQMLASISGDIVEGTAPSGTGSRILLTSRDTGLRGWDFDNTAMNKVSLAFEILDRAALPYPDRQLYPRQNVSTRLIHTDLTGDGVDELLTRRVTEDAAIFAYDISSGQPAAVASFDYPDRFDPLQHWLIPPLNRMYPQIAVARNDGYLTVFDDQLQPIDIGLDGGIPGIRIGGYYAAGAWRDLVRAPRIAALDAGSEEDIIVRDSRGALLRLDASGATLNVNPIKLWQSTNVLSANVVENLVTNGPGLACTSLVEPVTNPPTYQIQVLNPVTGDAEWSRNLPDATLNDVVAGTMTADSVPDLAVMWGASGDTLQNVRAFDGTNGDVLWDSTPLESGAGRQPAGLSIHDINDDSIDDVLLAGAGARALSGVDGADLAVLSDGTPYGMLIPWNIDADAPLEILLTATVRTLRAYQDDFSETVWNSSDDDRPYPYSALASCPNNDVLVSPSWQYPARIKLTDVTSGTYTTLVLADGQRFDDEAAAAGANAYLGQLTSVAVHSDLSGTGNPVAVIGSPGGWLYGLNPCDGTMVFATDFGVAVGEAVFGDIDGDGRDEILVTAADGYLYGLRQETIEPPGEVRDTDPSTGNDMDVDFIQTTDTLYAAWDAVMGATGYEVAVIDNTNTVITSPMWQMETSTAATISGLPLTDGERYRVMVRTVGPDGPSTDVTSNGVLVDFPPEMMDSMDADLEMDVMDPDVMDDATMEPEEMDETASDLEGGADGTADAMLDDDGTGSGGSDGCGCAIRTTESPSSSVPVLLTVLGALGLIVIRRRWD